MEAVIFTLIGTRNERSVPEPAEFQPFDLRALRHSYNTEDNSPSRRLTGRNRLWPRHLNLTTETMYTKAKI